ncbi:MAG: hypothetical protein ACRDRX_17630 [Pseudonocardiaceae bacterium]
MNDLPGGWKRAALADVCEVSPRDPALPAAAPFVPMTAVEVGQRYPKYFEERNSRGGVRAQPGDILFARITPCLENGKLAQIPAHSAPVGGSTEFIVVRAGVEIDPGYLYYWCQEPAVRAKAQSMMIGVTGRMRLSSRDLGTFQIAYPSMGDQQCIVEILEDHLSRLDAADGLTRSTEMRLHAWRRASLDSLVHKDSNGTIPLGSLIEQVEAGRSFGGSASPAGPDEWGIIRVSAMTWGEFRQDENKAVPADRVDPRYEIRAGDLLVSRANTTAYVGAPVLVQKTRPRLLLSDKSLRLVPKSGIDARWLAAVLAAPSTRRQISALATGTKDSMRNISQRNLLLVSVPRVTPAQQERIAARISSLRSNGSRLDNQLAVARARSFALRRSLLSAVFSGRLSGRSIDAEMVKVMAGV